MTVAVIDKDALFHYLGYEPHEGQQLVHRSTASRRVLACGVRWGKSTAAIHEAIVAALAPSEESRGWIVSPTFETSELLVRELLAIVERRLAHRVVRSERRARRLLLRNLAGNVAELEAKSADRPGSLLGESLDWCIVDEAARVRGELWHEFLRQRLLNRRGWALLTSTPRGIGDWFHEEFLRGQGEDDAYESWTAPSWQNPMIDQALVVAERERLASREFYSTYGGEFVGEFGRICPTCGWGKSYQRSWLSAEEWLTCTRCETCHCPIDREGRPVGFRAPDDTVALTVIRGPELPDGVSEQAFDAHLSTSA